MSEFHLIGQRFGQYILVRPIDSGGFADVYLGRHVYLRTYAAIKVLRKQLTDWEHSAFLQEARTIALLDHCNIVRVMDSGVKVGRPYLVMQYAANGSLRKRFPPGTRLPLATILDYIYPLADALDYIHSLGLVHQDVKLENFLISHHERIVLSDFGIAVSAYQTVSTSAGNIVGTVGYMAPERWRQQALPASDQYALGVVVYELLSGERPFRGRREDIIRQQKYDALPSLHTRFPEISIEVERVLFKALHKNPGRRFENVTEFVLTLYDAMEYSHSSSENREGPIIRWFFEHLGL